MSPAQPAALEARVVVAARGVDAGISVAAGQTLALLGRNGAGKSTVLEVLAGLVSASDGRAALGEACFYDTPQGMTMPARDRHIAFVSQDTSLFPRLTAHANVAFGLLARGAPKREAHLAAHAWLDRVGAADLAGRMPAHFSGGQARRVSIARALAVEPKLVLLDEPFAGLDLESATGIRALMTQVLGDVTTVISTHDALDAFALADTVAIMDEGSIAEHGPVSEVLTRPHTTFAARMAGRVLVAGTATRAGLLHSSGVEILAKHRVAQGTPVAAAIHPRDIALGKRGIVDHVTAVEPRGDVVRVHGTWAAADVDPASAAGLRPGDAVRFDIGGTAIEIYPTPA